MFRSTHLWLAIVVVALIQTAALSWMVFDRLSLIKNGKEITLAIRPVDPRSLFRGDYVILNPEIARITTQQVLRDVKRNDTIYVVVQRALNGTWSYVSLHTSQPKDLGGDRVALKARVKSIWPKRNTNQTQLQLRYGIESYFVPEGTGKELEKKVRERQIRAIVAVSDGGVAAIKGLEISGERILDPPLL